MTKNTVPTSPTVTSAHPLLPEEECLAGRINLWQIREYCLQLKHDECLQDRIFLLLSHTNIRVASNAAWILTHLDTRDMTWLHCRFHTLADMAMQSSDNTLQRLLLTLVCRLPHPAHSHIVLFNFCMEQMLSCRQTYGVRSLCMKLAYKTALSEPPLLEEVRMTLELMEPASLPPSLYSCRKNILSALGKRRDLRH